MKFGDALDADSPDARALAAEQRKTADVRRERDGLRRALEDSEREREDLASRLHLVEKVTDLDPHPPKWLTPKRKRSSHHATVTTILSDSHLDEVVNPDEIGGVNAYDRAIATLRLHRYFASVIELARDYMAGVTFDGAVCMLGGDLLSGDIHDELTNSNEDTVLGSLLYWSEHIAAGFDMLADEFGSVYGPVVVGNHGRRSRKPRAKGRARDNFDWLLAHLVAREFRNDDRVTFAIPDAAHIHFDVYNHKYRLEHGDSARGGSGWMGVLGPAMRRDQKVRSQTQATGQGYDTLVMGHWHRLSWLSGVVVNGCFPSGTRVMTSTGYSAIEKIAEGDSVMSRDGTEQKVAHVFEQTGDRLVRLKVMGLPNVVSATPNHLVWAAKSSSNVVPPSRRHLMGARVGPAQWIPIDFLSPGDYVHVPFPIGQERPVTVEDAWAYGLYLAEGHDTLDGGSSGKHNRVHITMHRDEMSIVERWADWFEGRFGQRPRTHHRANRNTSDLVVSPGREVTAWFRETFGHGAINKHLPEGALWWDDELKAALLDGWVTGDGHSAAQPDCRPTVSATTISPIMAWGMFHIAPAAGVWPSLSKLSKGGTRKNDSYTVHLNTGQNVQIINGEAFYKIGERFESEGEVVVHDLEVTGEHTYVVEGVGVHNSSKGLDEYAAIEGFGYEPPQQAMWLTTPERGMTLQAPVFVEDRKKEKW